MKKLLATSAVALAALATSATADDISACLITKTDTNPLLLKTHMAAGHGGLPGRFAALEETGLIFAFLLDTLAPGRV